MVSRALRIAITLLAGGLLTRADNYQVVRMTFDGHDSVSTEYVKGQNRRVEHTDPRRNRRLVTISLLEGRTSYVLDAAAKEYVEAGGVDWILTLAQWISPPPRIKNSGKTVNVYYEAVDTGERRVYFGQTARHLVFRERRVAEPGACEPSRDTERDGWYLQDLQRPGQHRYTALVTALVGGRAQVCRDNFVMHGSAIDPPPAVLETTRTRWIREPGNEVSSFSKREVLDFSTDPLDEKLFEVPPGFKKVDNLPGYPTMSWASRLQWDWSLLERAVASWVE